MPVQDPSHEVRNDQPRDAVALCMYVFLRHTDPSGRLDKTKNTTLLIAGQMVFDLFDAAGIQPERLLPDLISGRPHHVREAVNAFCFLGNLLDGCCSNDPARRFSAFAFLARERRGTLVAEGGSVRADLGASSRNFAQSAFFLSEEVYQEIKNELGLTFARMSDLGQIDGEAFYALSVGGEFKNGSFYSASEESIVQTAIPPLPAALVRRRSLEDIPEHLLLVVEKRPQVWTLTISSACLIIFLFLAVMLGRSFHHPAQSVSRASAAANRETPRTVVPQAPSPPVATTSPTPSVKPKPSAKEKDLGVQDLAQTVQREKPLRGELLYSQQQIQTLLATADRLSGNGKYDEAIARYRQVLKQDPQNAEAIRGLRRALLNKAE